MAPALAYYSTVDKGGNPMKGRNPPSSCVRLDRAASAPTAAGVVARKLSYARTAIRRKAETMKMPTRELSVGLGDWNRSEPWSSLSNLLEAGGFGARPEARWRAEALARAGAGWPRRVQGGTAEHHLLLALRCAEHLRGAFWETAGFLAIWLAGLAGIVICLI